ncbi:LuxE/PaaK family acyltransferase [Zunongwangia sp. HGR-M22]|uniref:LuxE/PaaK family acyltransferase n=1 Tax=Zunongwangia sp. HGR-M22 TaxID=3015168 RepID=UPI0022DDA3D8|nr:acyl transferase [Zunongwangia sp. HGR-M22]WBL25956.1 acyl transferase [Zunongwangia sp. HGR-M22]
MQKSKIFDIQSKTDFEKISLEIFEFQYKNNKTYQDFCNHLNKTPGNVQQLEDIPFLPIEFFKSHRILSENKPIEITFTSSGTTGNKTSKHLVTDLDIYEQSFEKAFQKFYGAAEDITILALLPSYLEREGSSLIYMAEHLIQKSQKKESGFYLHNLEELKYKLIELDKKGEKTLLIGVSFALLDLVENHQFELKNTIVMETGGMKGRRKEMIREELHSILAKGFGVSSIHSEYGMTELLSQAYSKGNGVFECPPWMDLIIRDPEDALTTVKSGKTGGINVIDLANINSCSFIATQDLGKINKDGTIEILGRFDNSDIRGCNLMVL